MGILLYWQTPSIMAPSLQLYKESFRYPRGPLWSSYSHHLPWPRHLTTTYVFPVFIGFPLSECLPALTIQMLPFRSALYHFATLSLLKKSCICCTCVCLYGPSCAMECVWGCAVEYIRRSEVNLQESVLSFHHWSQSLARFVIGLEQWVLTYWAILPTCPPFLDRSCW